MCKQVSVSLPLKGDSQATNFTITPELLDQLLANYEKPEDLTGDDGLFKQLKKALIERALGAELTDHLGYEKGDPAGRGSGNSRNGTSSKTILTEEGEIAIAIPRDRVGSFEPQLIAKGQTRFDGFDDKILSLYARGMTVREIQGHLAELYGTDVSADLISRVTELRSSVDPRTALSQAARVLSRLRISFLKLSTPRFAPTTAP
jgi:putative transposase